MTTRGAPAGFPNKYKFRHRQLARQTWPAFAHTVQRCERRRQLVGRRQVAAAGARVASPRQFGARGMSAMKDCRQRPWFNPASTVTGTANGTRQARWPPAFKPTARPLEPLYPVRGIVTRRVGHCRPAPTRTQCRIQSRNGGASRIGSWAAERLAFSSQQSDGCGVPRRVQQTT